MPDHGTVDTHPGRRRKKSHRQDVEATQGLEKKKIKRRRSRGDNAKPRKRWAIQLELGRAKKVDSGALGKKT